jgi:hypothetical protein
MQFLSSFGTKKKKPEASVASQDASIPPDAEAMDSTGTSTPTSEAGPSWDPTALSISTESTSEGGLKTLQPSVLRDMRADVMVNWLHSKQEERIWTTGAPGEGVILKVTKGQYVCCPSELRNDSSSLFDMVSMLNVRVRQI